MDKEKSDRGVRTEESGVGDNLPVTDAASGDEGIDDASGDKPFIPGEPEKYTVEQSNDMDPESMGQRAAEDAPRRTSTPPRGVSNDD